ncbi:MAG: MFS transporter, partial [Catenulispora sp.]|nr:MFS transporter [Catenulispora sp.]
MSAVTAEPAAGWQIKGLRRRRVACSLLFLSYGTVLGAWTSRIPAVRHGLGLSDTSLSTALTAFAAGAIAGMQSAGRLVDRYGSRQVMVPAAGLDALLLITPAFAPNLAVLMLCLFCFGAIHGTLNVAMNAYAVEVQRDAGRPIISSFHAVYSIGGFAGAGIGGLFARGGFGAGTTFAAVCVTAAAIVTQAARLSRVSKTTNTNVDTNSEASAELTHDAALNPDETSQLKASEPTNHRSRITGTLFLGLLAFCCLVGEGAAADWSAVYLRDDLSTTASFAALAYAAFSIAMTAGRLIGDRLTAALGPVLLVRCCGLVASLGLATGLLINEPIAAVIGFGCLGAGLSCIAPQVFSTAGLRNPHRAGLAIARVASVGFLGFVIGPVLIGAISGLVGLPWALTIPVVLVLFVAAAATALRP